MSSTTNLANYRKNALSRKIARVLSISVGTKYTAIRHRPINNSTNYYAIVINMVGVIDKPLSSYFHRYEYIRDI